MSRPWSKHPMMQVTRDSFSSLNSSCCCRASQHPRQAIRTAEGRADRFTQQRKGAFLPEIKSKCEMSGRLPKLPPLFCPSPSPKNPPPPAPFRWRLLRRLLLGIAPQGPLQRRLAAPRHGFLDRPHRGSYRGGGGAIGVSLRMAGVVGMQ